MDESKACELFAAGHWQVETIYRLRRQRCWNGRMCCDSDVVDADY